MYKKNEMTLGFIGSLTWCGEQAVNYDSLNSKEGGLSIGSLD